MADIPRDIGALAKQIRDFTVESASDLRHLSEMCRALCMDAAEVIDLAEYEMRTALTYFDSGNSKRAQQVTRPLRHAGSLLTFAARRCAGCWRAYLKAFAEAGRRPKSGRRFDPEK